VTAALDHLFRIAEAPFTRGPNAGALDRLRRRQGGFSLGLPLRQTGPPWAHAPRLRTCLQPEAVSATSVQPSTRLPLRSPCTGIPTPPIPLLPARPGSYATPRPGSTLDGGLEEKSIMMVISSNNLGLSPGPVHGAVGSSPESAMRRDEVASA
jgi:hypothetical protein